MRDPRLEKLADILVHYSTAVKPGDLVRISGNPLSLPLVTAIYRSVIKAGGNPFVSMAPDECGEIKLTEGAESQLLFENPIIQFEIETIDVSIGIFGSDNTKSLSRVDPARQATLSKARKKYFDTFLGRSAADKLRWVGTQFPCHASAQDAERSLTDYEEFVFTGGMLHLDDPVAAWTEVSRRQQLLVDFLTDKKELRFVTPKGTDLKMNVEGRTWLNSDGKKNFPDGEVHSAPLEDSTEGIVRYDFPAVHGGREVHGIELRFKEGRVVDASADKGEDFLISMLDQDPGARCLGEIAFGTNYAIKEFTKNTLFDEKIGGTFHAAVGAAYPESGGTNQSSLHWDMICDLREGGQVYADGELFTENGRFHNKDFPCPV